VTHIYVCGFLIHRHLWISHKVSFITISQIYRDIKTQKYLFIRGRSCLPRNFYRGCLTQKKQGFLRKIWYYNIVFLYKYNFWKTIHWNRGLLKPPSIPLGTLLHRCTLSLYRGDRRSNVRGQWLQKRKPAQSDLNDTTLPHTYVRGRSCTGCAAHLPPLFDRLPLVNHCPVVAHR